MNDNDLIYIKTIAETKNISQAAKILYVSQPSLSRSLQRIETELGIVLFNRTQNGMRLTEAGKLFYQCASNMLNMLDNFKTDVSFLNDLRTGSLSIGTTSFLGTAILPDTIAKYHELYPHVTLNVEELSTTQLEQLLLTGDLDLGVMHMHQEKIPEDLHYEIISQDFFILIASEQESIPTIGQTDDNGLEYVNLNDLSHKKFLSYKPDKRMSEVSRAIFRCADFEPDIILELRSYQTVKKLVAKGMGISFIPYAYSDFFANSHNIKKYRLYNVSSDIWYTSIVTNPNIYHSKATEEYIRIIKEFALHNKTL